MAGHQGEIAETGPHVHRNDKEGVAQALDFHGEHMGVRRTALAHNDRNARLLDQDAHTAPGATAVSAATGLGMRGQELARPRPRVGSVPRRRRGHRRQVGLLDQEDTAAQGLQAIQAPRAISVPSIE
eukprot:10796349-Alexandrium_andersonii.AAC.1